MSVYSVKIHYTSLAQSLSLEAQIHFTHSRHAVCQIRSIEMGSPPFSSERTEPPQAHTPRHHSRVAVGVTEKKVSAQDVSLRV